MATVLENLKDFFFGRPQDQADDGYENNYDEYGYEDDYDNDGYAYEEDEPQGREERESSHLFNRFRREDRSRNSYARQEENDGYRYDYEERRENTSGPTRIILMKAKRFAEVKRVADNLKQGRSVLINFEDMDKDEAQRTIDFLSGAAFAKDGKVQKVSRSSIIFAVGAVDLVGRIDDINDADSYFSF